MIIATARDAADLLVPLFALAEGEKVVAAHLDGEQRLIAAIEGDGGSEDAVPLPIRQIIGDALRLGSAGIVLAHNHPSGDLAPSTADLDATRALAAVAMSMGVQLHDHLIVGADGDCRSLRALGLM